MDFYSVKSIAVYFGIQTPCIDTGLDMPDTGVLDSYVDSIKELIAMDA